MSATTIRVAQIRLSPVEVYRNLNLLNTGSVIKNSPGVLTGFDFVSTQNAKQYIKFYDKATAPTSADPVKYTAVVEAVMPARFVLPGEIEFASGISIRATKNLADNDNTAPTANSIFGSVFYI